MARPEIVERHIDVVSHLRRTLRKHRDKVPQSLAQQLCGMLAWYLSHRLRGETEIHPGRKRMAQWAEASPRTVTTNVAYMKLYRIVDATAFKGGGRNRATHFVFDMEALARWLILIGANPSKQLLAKIRDLRPAAPFRRQKMEENVEIVSTCKGIDGDVSHLSENVHSLSTKATNAAGFKVGGKR